MIALLLGHPFAIPGLIATIALQCAAAFGILRLIRRELAERRRLTAPLAGDLQSRNDQLLGWLQ